MEAKIKDIFIWGCGIINMVIKNTRGTFKKEDIRNACPDVSESTINRVFKKLQEEVIELLEKGRAVNKKGEAR